MVEQIQDTSLLVILLILCLFQAHHYLEWDPKDWVKITEILSLVFSVAVFFITVIIRIWQ